MADYVHCTHHPTDSDRAALFDMKLRAHDEETWPKVPKTYRMVEDLIRELREHPHVEGFELKLKF